MAFNTVSALLAADPDISNVFVVCMGLGVVFVGLLSIVILSTIMSAVIRSFEGKKTTAAPAAAPAAPVAAAPIANRGELVAAIAACVAEELGTDVSGIRIVSIKAL